jgi:hypothetical protein
MSMVRYRRAVARSPPPAGPPDLDAATHSACFMAAVLPARGQARDHRGGPGEGGTAMGDSDSGYQFGTGIGEEELARLEAQGAAIAPATRMIFAEAGIQPGRRRLSAHFN